ncbi:hypothetical protein NIIDNTM18_21730 [Mycolicibacterium litorale]|uniref:Uncharacterized protein n=2 Tax=Mycolicibacterium litorale TaxID=758802 RepID=A0A6S6P348_9MYCO|nr:hypothetical protein NIIDNTM18_21730 [Mycolicibacterium litorale]
MERLGVARPQAGRGAVRSGTASCRVLTGGLRDFLPMPTQMVLDRFPSIAQAYMSLLELSHRTRYDVNKLGPMTVPGAQMQWKSIKTFCEGLNSTRETIPTQQP